MPPKFADFSKDALDLLGDDYGSKKYFKVKYSTPPVQGCAVGFTSETNYMTATAKPGKPAVPGALFGKLSAKWKHACGFSVDKLALEKDGTPKLELSMSKLMPGVKLGCTSDLRKKQGNVSVDYNDDLVSAGLKAKSTFDEAEAAVVLAHQGLQVGGCLSYTAKDKLQDYKVALGYAMPLSFLSLAASEKLKKFTLIGMHKPMPELTVALCGSSKLEAEADKAKESSLELGASYAVATDLSVKGKYAMAKGERPKNSLECAVNYDLLKKVKLIGGLEVPIEAPSSYKCGLGINLG